MFVKTETSGGWLGYPVRPNVPVWARDCRGQTGSIKQGTLEESGLRSTAGERHRRAEDFHAPLCICHLLCKHMLLHPRLHALSAFTLSQNKASRQRQLSRRRDDWFFSGQQSPLDKQFLCYCLGVINCPLRRPEMRFLQLQGMQARTSSYCFLVNTDRERRHLVKRRVRDGSG